MINVLYINHVSEFSGAERVLLNLIGLLDKSPVNPTTICPDNGKLVQELNKKGIQVKLTSMPLLIRTYNPFKLLEYLQNFLFFSKVLKKELRRLNTDIIHCNTFTAALYSILPALLAKTPIIWHMHDILEDRFFNKVFIRLAASRVDRIICVSNAVKNNLVGFGVNREKCTVIYNSTRREACNKDTSSGDFRKEIGAGINTKIITMVGQIAEWKGQSVFIEAASRLIKRHRDVRFVIVGDIISPMTKGYKERIHKMAADLKLSDSILFTGFRDDIAGIMSDSDVIVHASIRPDPLPTVIIEAMKSGKPVVATDVGGVPELMTDNDTGFIVPPKDADALADAVSRLLEDPVMAERMGLAGREVAQTRFNPQENLFKVLGLYNSLLPCEKKIFQ